MGQTIADFENFQLEQDTFLNGSDGSGGFESGNIRLTNNFDSAYGSWNGWAISNTTDTTTPGFVNQYSSITGGGQDGSSHYATAFVSGESLLHTINDARGGVVEGLYITNSTYSYLSMLEGDAFAKRFGGEDGNDPDFLYITIKEYGSRNVSNDSINIFLADYRFDDNSMDFLLDTWVYVDLTRFENVDTLSFTMNSSDRGVFGINTPTYFCIDNVTTADAALTSTEDSQTPKPSKLYPNPAHSSLTLEGHLQSYVIMDTKGYKIQTGILTNKNRTVIELHQLPVGLYNLIAIDENGERFTERFVKI